VTTDPSVRGKDGGAANTNIVWHAGKLLAVEERHPPFALDPDTLASQGYWDFAAALKTGRFTAHPKIDPETGEMVFFGYSIGGAFTTTIAYGFVDRTGRLTLRDTFEAPYSALVHDFLVTRNYVLFAILPLTASLERAMKGAPVFAWEPEKGGYVGVVRRDSPSSTMRWFRCDPCFVPHGMNAYEDGNKIVAHVMQLDGPPSVDPNGKGETAKGVARLHRWTFDLASTSDGFVREPIDDLPADFPRLDERFALNPYRYGFFAAMQKQEYIDTFDLLVRLDLQTGQRTTYGVPSGDALSEPVFVPRTGSSTEGDGYLLATIYRAAENRSDLAIFDAATLGDGPIALAQLSHRVPLGFHGNWRSIA
jgi:carotenoid cleavage dioxygenase-like enzyme